MREPGYPKVPIVSLPMKSLFLSFLSPCGRIGNAGFWWRQLLVAVLLCPASAWLAHTLTWMKWGAWSDFAPVPFSFMQVSPLAYLPSALAGSEAVNDVRLSDGWAPDTLAGVHLSPALLVGALLVCLLSWCSFALSLRRLRDSRTGLYLLPLCLPAWCSSLAYDVFEWSYDSRLILRAVVTLLSVAVLSMRSHRD